MNKLKSVPSPLGNVVIAYLFNTYLALHWLETIVKIKSLRSLVWIQFYLYLTIFILKSRGFELQMAVGLTILFRHSWIPDSRDPTISSFMFVRVEKNRRFPCGMRISQKKHFIVALKRQQETRQHDVRVIERSWSYWRLSLCNNHLTSPSVRPNTQPAHKQSAVLTRFHYSHQHRVSMFSLLSMSFKLCWRSVYLSQISARGHACLT